MVGPPARTTALRVVMALAVGVVVGCGVAGQLPSSGLRALSAVAGDAVCVCRERRLPQWAAWADTHMAWHCTVVLPRDASAPVAPCALANTQPPVPTGFDVRGGTPRRVW